MKGDKFSFRVSVIFGIFVLMGALIAVRLFFLQVIKGEYFRERGDNQYLSLGGNEFNRGEIYFQKKGGELFSAASLKRGFMVEINSKLIINAEEAYNKLSSLIEINKEEFLAIASKKEGVYKIIASRLPKEKAEQISSLKISGINIIDESWRCYPGDNLASQSIGFVGYKGDDFSGRYGLEKFYDDVLKRELGSGVGLNSFAEIFTDIKKSLTKNSLERGDLILTIEPVLQTFVEKELNKIVEKYTPQMAGAIVIEPKTGRILAMGAKPDFNPNLYNKVGDISVFMNPAIESVFEMGSIVKPLTMAAALDQGAVTAETKYTDEGFLILSGKRIENFDGKARGLVDMQEVLNQSLNTGATFAMQKLGKDKFKEYIANYGFGEKTGIDLPAELKGMTANLENKRDIEYANASFGQGIAVTPIEMAVALSSLANGGLIMKPYVVEKIKLSTGVEKIFSPQEKRRVLKKETSDEISRMLSVVVDKALLGGAVKMEHYSIAAKTGTAQITTGGTGYSEDQFLHSFFGYAPAFDARFLVLLYVNKPVGVKYASQSLTDSFMAITKFAINYYNIPPDR